MATPSSEPPPQENLENEEEAETKPFLDHLEDLRWTILKSLAALLVCMCIAFYGLPVIMKALEWPLHGVAELVERVPLLQVGDLKDSKTFVERLRNASDPVSRHLRDQLSEGLKKQLHECDLSTIPPKPLRAALVQELNKVLEGECLYTDERFAQVPLTDDVRELLEAKPKGGARVRLNRRLLEAAYPDQIAKAITVSGFEASKFLYTIGPGEVFIFSIKLAVYAGSLLALPFILYYIGQFILPALTRREKRYLWPAFSIGGGLFFIGAGFCFFYVMPKALMVSIAWARWMNLDVTFWRVGEYVAFVCGFMLGMGLAFETPVVILALVKMGLLSHMALRKGRRYWVVFSLVAGALLTTPEVFTQLVMGAVLMILYEISIWGAWWIEYRERKRALAGDSPSPGGHARK